MTYRWRTACDLRSFYGFYAYRICFQSQQWECGVDGGIEICEIGLGQRPTVLVTKTPPRMLAYVPSSGGTNSSSGRLGGSSGQPTDFMFVLCSLESAVGIKLQGRPLRILD